MKKFDYTVKVSEGLHARPAGLLVKCAKDCSSDIKILNAGKSADAKRLFSVMSLGVKQNDKITLTAEGNNEDNDLEKLKLFCEKNI